MKHSSLDIVVVVVVVVGVVVTTTCAPMVSISPPLSRMGHDPSLDDDDPNSNPTQKDR